jgi:hypothetical protein
MHIRSLLPLLMVVACARPARRDPAPAPPTDHATHDHATHMAQDTAFASMQQRGKTAMGVDQYASAHVFESLPDGGRIELQMSTNDPAGAAAIQAHMKDIAAAFSSGNFAIPGFVHAQNVPGTPVMAAKRSSIRYEPVALPRGGAVRITTTDRDALAAIHAFLAFQRREHRTGG